MNVKNTSCISCSKSLLNVNSIKRFPIINGKRMPICKKCMKEIDSARYAYTNELKEEYKNIILAKIARQPDEVKDTIVEYIYTRDDVSDEIKSLKKESRSLKYLMICLLVSWGIFLLIGFISFVKTDKLLDDLFDAYSNPYGYDDYFDDYYDNDRDLF